MFFTHFEYYFVHSPNVLPKKAFVRKEWNLLYLFHLIYYNLKLILSYLSICPMMFYVCSLQNRRMDGSNYLYIFINDREISLGPSLSRLEGRFTLFHPHHSDLKLKVHKIKTHTLLYIELKPNK